MKNAYIFPAVIMSNDDYICYLEIYLSCTENNHRSCTHCLETLFWEALSGFLLILIHLVDTHTESFAMVSLTATLTGYFIKYKTKSVQDDVDIYPQS